jgi:hypothetical protein
MYKQARFRILYLILLVIVSAAMLPACSEQAETTETTGASPISVNNDTVEAGDQGAVTDPDAGKLSGTYVNAEPLPAMKPGITAPPEETNPMPDLLASVSGTVPTIPHGSTNGEGCLTCHESGSGGSTMLPQNHVDADLADEYCRSCHQDA